jgi:serine/threonine-protein kinase
MSQPPDRPSADHNMLFGIFALQMDFIRQDALVAAMHAWVLDKKKTLGQILLEQGQMSSEQHQALDSLIAQHLKAHGDNPRRSLEALSAVSTVPHGLARVADAEFQESLASWSSVSGRRLHERAGGNGCRYRVLRPHKEGGLGTVLVAEDTELHREVALKEIKPEYADDPVFRDRFLLEGEITGRLEHPGIVPVYGLGVYDDGRPYYAMRFIDKGTLKQAIDDFHAADKPGRDPGKRSLAFRELLRHFIDACKAVAYAHDRGVLHRDIKPGNIMLGNYGETLVVDWGLAKAGVRSADSGDPTQDETRAPTLHPWSGSEHGATRSGVRMGTLGFSSPEQSAGRLDELGPPSDVYSLGATLYALLTGRKPFFDAESDEIADWVQCGRLTPPRQAKTDTPRALDAICRKAMAVRPADRYPRAVDLANDLEHWLANEPVAAYREPWIVRAGRWGRRHRTLLVGASVLLLSAVAALAVSTTLIWREQQRTAAQKQLAEKNYGLARELTFNSIDWIERSQVDLASAPHLQADLKEILITASRSCRQFLEQQPENIELRKRSAQVFRYTANSHRLGNELETAEPLYWESIRLYRELAEQYPEEAAYRQKWAETLRDCAIALGRVGRLRDAIDNLHQAEEVADRLHEEQPARAGHARLLGTILLDRSAYQHTCGRVSESEKSAERAAGLFGRLVTLPDAGQRHAYDPILLAMALNRTAVARREAKQYQEAEAAHAQAIGRLEVMQKALPRNRDIQHNLARFRLERCRTLAQRPEHRPEAERDFGEVAGVWQKMTAENPRIPMYREWQGIAYQARGELRAQDRSTRPAREDFEKSRELLEKLIKDFPKVPGYRGELGQTYLGLGRLARLAGDEAGAREAFNRADAALRQACEEAPENALYRRCREEVRSEQSKVPGR